MQPTVCVSQSQTPFVVHRVNTWGKLTTTDRKSCFRWHNTGSGARTLSGGHLSRHYTHIGHNFDDKGNSCCLFIWRTAGKRTTSANGDRPPMRYGFLMIYSSPSR